MVEVISAVVLTLHLLCMNVAAAGPLVAAWLDQRACRQDKEAEAAVRFLARACWQLVVIGGLLGFVQGWLRWDSDYRELLGRFAPRITWGILEFGFSTLLIAAYAGWIVYRPHVGKGVWLARTLLAALAATNLLYHFPPLFSMLAGAAAGQLAVGEVVDSATFRSLLVRGEILAITTHFIIASFAVSGTVLVAFGTGLVGRPATVRPSIALGGGRIALATTLLQLPVGLWLIVQLPASAQRRLLGEDPAAATLLIAGLLASFWLLHLLAAVAFGDVSRSAAKRTLLLMAVVVLLMSGVLQRAQLRNGATSRAGATSVPPD